MAVMVRNEVEIKIKWMFTISVLFHLLFLFTILSSNLFNKDSLSDRRNVPLSSVFVSIVDMPNEKPLETPAVEKKINVAKVEEPVKKESKKEAKKEAKKDEIVAGSQKPEVTDQKKIIQKAKLTMQEPAAKEKIADTQDTKEAKLITSGPVVSGPVVDIPNFKYDYYLGVIRNKIESRWSQPIAYTQIRQALIEFIIHRNGEIDNVRVVQSSGDTYFDQTALRAVSLSKPLPPLPRGYKEDFLKVHYKFIFGGKG